MNHVKPHFIRLYIAAFGLCLLWLLFVVMSGFELKRKVSQTLSSEYITLATILTETQVLSNKLKQELDELIVQKAHFNSKKLSQTLMEIEATLPSLYNQISTTPLSSLLQPKLLASAELNQQLTEITLAQLRTPKQPGYYCQMLEINLRKLHPELSWLVSNLHAELKGVLNASARQREHINKVIWFGLTLTFIIVSFLTLAVLKLLIRNSQLSVQANKDDRSNTLKLSYFESKIDAKIKAESASFALAILHFQTPKSSLTRRQNQELIQKIAEQLNQITDHSCDIASYTSNDLCMVMDCKSKGEAFISLDDLRRKIEDHPTVLPNSHQNIQVSIGLVFYPSKQHSHFTALLDHAEIALEIALQSGGSQTRLFEDDLAPIAKTPKNSL